MTILPVLVVVALATAWFAIPFLLRRRATRRLAQTCRRKRAIVLTYDDGPGEALTPRLADLLARRGVAATFFVIGRNATARPGLIARLRRDGHEIGNHSQDHVNAWKSLPWTAARDLHAGRRSLAGLGIEPRTYRPPYGKTTPATLAALHGSGQSAAFWTVDSRDSWEQPRPVDEVLAALDAGGGGVVLMHDFDRPRRARDGRDHPAHVLELTDAVIGFAARNGFRLLRFADLEMAPDAVSTAGQPA